MIWVLKLQNSIMKKSLNPSFDRNILQWKNLNGWPGFPYFINLPSSLKYDSFSSSSYATLANHNDKLRKHSLEEDYDEEFNRNKSKKGFFFGSILFSSMMAFVGYYYWNNILVKNDCSLFKSQIAQHHFNELKKQAFEIGLETLQQSDHQYMILDLISSRIENDGIKSEKLDIGIEIMDNVFTEEQERKATRLEMEYSVLAKVCQLEEVGRDQNGLNVQVAGCNSANTMRHTSLDFYFPLAIKIGSNANLEKHPKEMHEIKNQEGVEIICLHVKMEHLSDKLIKKDDKTNKNYSSIFFVTQISLCDAEGIYEKGKLKKKGILGKIRRHLGCSEAKFFDFSSISPRKNEIILEKALAPAGLYVSNKGYMRTKIIEDLTFK